MTLSRLLVALFLTAVAGRAAVADDAATRTAKLHFERGEKLYALARFTEAIGEYQLAFDARPIPEFLFNIGQCHRNLGDYDAAIFSYQKYLKLAPEAPNRAQVEQLIADLQAKADKREAERLGLTRPHPPEPEPGASPVAPSPAPPAAIDERASVSPPSRGDRGDRGDRGIRVGRGDRPLYTRWWFWTGIAVVGVAGGVVVYDVTRPGGPPSTTLGNIVFGK
ncbi:MAG TPA: tetratricopeptide repeat protein [Kofleriaceae bacterium]|nr:tetratricopeptide repeat protein [Kofleriaceae bacterium]